MVRSEFLVAGDQEPLQRRLVGVTGISGGEIAFGRTGNLGIHIITLNSKKRSNPHAMVGYLTSASNGDRTRQMCVILTRAVIFLTIRARIAPLSSSRGNQRC
jgi:hypothetical protein